jgi:hypothetical protein
MGQRQRVANVAVSTPTAAIGNHPSNTGPMLASGLEPRQVRLQVDRFYDVTDAQTKLLAELESRLAELIPPVPADNSVAGTEPGPLMAPFAQMLHDLVERVNRANQRIGFLLEHLEI